MSKKLSLIVALFMAVFVTHSASAQDPNVSVFIDNPQYISPTQYEFDIALKSTESTSSFQLRTFQAGLYMSFLWVNGGTITASIAPGFSEMTGNGYDGSFQWNNTDNLLNCSVNLGVRPSSSVCLATPVSTDDFRIVRIRLTNTASFGCSSPDIQFNYVQNASPLRLRTTITWRPSGCSNFDIYYPNRTFTGSARFNNELLSADTDGRSPASTQFNLGNCSPILQLKAFIQGYYLGGNQMESPLFNTIPRTSYTQTDSVDVVLHSAIDPSMILFTKRTVLNSNGTLSVVIPQSVSGQVYIAIKSRNIMESWSQAVDIQGNTIYDFTNDVSKTFGDNSASLGDGNYGFYIGDIDQDGGIDGYDLSLIYNDANTFEFGYNKTDCSGDGSTDGIDLSYVYNNSQFFLFTSQP